MKNHTKTVIISLIIFFVLFFLFYNLGHHALWDDEANTALFGESVWETGDTSAIRGQNIIAYRNGKELKDLKNRYIPPLQYYVVAPFAGIFKGSAFAVRLPFAIFGLFSVLLVVYWFKKLKTPFNTAILFFLGILGNVSFFLFSRQCRYYSLAIFFSLLLVFLYMGRNSYKKTVMISVVSLLLLLSNYMSYLAIYVCIFFDYSFWGKTENKLTRSELITIFVPQIILGGIFISIYGMSGNELAQDFGSSWIFDRIKLLVWNIRDLNSCELGVGLLILIAPFLYFITKDKLLLRCPLAIFIYCFVIALLSPQPKYGLSVAFVRYLAPIIPICILTAVRVIEAIKEKNKLAAIVVAVLSFGTNVLHGGPFVGTDNNTWFSQVIAKGRFRSTVFEYVKELINPPPSAYKEVSYWMRNNIKKKGTVLVIPAYAAYPLMYHAPHVIYAWQLEEPIGQFRSLDNIHFIEKEFPEYIIFFGPYYMLNKDGLERLKEKGAEYVPYGKIEKYWYDLTRPELFWHAFSPITDIKQSDIIIVLRKKIK